MTTSTTAPGGLEARPPERRVERSPAEIEAEIERTRVRLAGTVDAITERVKPGNLARSLLLSAKAHLRDEAGGLRTRPAAVLALAAAAGVGLVIWRRSR